MNKLIPFFVLFAAAVVWGAQEGPKSKGIFTMIKEGQAVDLKDEGAAYSISVYGGDLPTSHTVIEVADDYIVVRDVAGITETALPVYSVKSIVKMNLKVE